MEKRWIMNVQENDAGEVFIEFPEDSLEGLGWKEGDVLQWSDNHDGSFTLSKKDLLTEWVLVECVDVFRTRYVVEVPRGKKDWALDTVTMNEAKVFSSEHIAEDIMSHRVVAEEEALKLCDEDNQYAIDWSDDKKIDVFFTPREDLK